MHVIFGIDREVSNLARAVLASRNLLLFIVVIIYDDDAMAAVCF
jgi:hypothetical protein